MKQIRLAALLFCVILLTVFFNYIYVRSVRDEMLQQINRMCEAYTESQAPNQAQKIWKNRKGLLSLSVPLTVLDQIDIQLSIVRACSATKDTDAYLRSCHHLHELVSSLGG